MKKQEYLKRARIIVIALIIILGGAFAIYVNHYYHADDHALASLQSTETVMVWTLQKDTLVFSPKEARVGLIFYPGGKVQYESYAPLMQSLAEQGILCVLVHMPWNLAVLDVNAADGIKEKFSGITTWYLGGHSLGGSMAASYVENHAEEYEGLILLASYSTADLSKTGLKVLSIYGSNDGVLSLEKYEQNKTNLPEDVVEHVIDGGCHAYFGSYGTQDGDGTPMISAEEQIADTVKVIMESIER